MGSGPGGTKQLTYGVPNWGLQSMSDVDLYLKEKGDFYHRTQREEPKDMHGVLGMSILLI